MTATSTPELSHALLDKREGEALTRLSRSPRGQPGTPTRDAYLRTKAQAAFTFRDIDAARVELLKRGK
jgi:hypothetical protein